MKKILLLLFCLPLIFSNCQQNNPTPPSSNPCNLVQENIQFSQIQQGMNHSQIANILGSNGDHFRTDNLGSGNEMRFYRWSYCNDFKRLECWLRNDTIHLKVKTFDDGSCSNNINQTTYSSISVGDTYSTVSTILNGAGDNFRVDYNPPTYPVITTFYSWYDCADSSNYIQVWFNNDSAHLITKSL